jgi:selenocysteine lyase/cysteine desulfurase
MLSQVPGLTFHTPEESERCAGLLTCAIPGWEAEALSQHLWERGRILTNTIREWNAVRFSVAFFNTEGELDAAASALLKVARGNH